MPQKSNASARGSPIPTYALKLFRDIKVANSARGHNLSKEKGAICFAIPIAAIKVVEPIIQYARSLSSLSV